MREKGGLAETEGKTPGEIEIERERGGRVTERENDIHEGRDREGEMDKKNRERQREKTDRQRQIEQKRERKSAEIERRKLNSERG